MCDFCHRRRTPACGGACYIIPGISSIPGSAAHQWHQKSDLNQRLTSQFPTRRNREFLRPCREFKSAIREISALIRESRSRLLFCRQIRSSREISDVAERQTRGAVRWPQISGSSEVRRKPRCVNVGSISRNSLTKPSNCSRTYHELRNRSFDPRGARAEDGQGVGCWGTWQVKT